MKGISVYIATVLIISITVAVGVIMGPWIYRLVTSLTENASEESEQELECQYGGIRIIDDSIKCSFTGSDKLNFTIENSGTIDLYNLICGIYLNGNISSYTVNDSLTNSPFTKDSPLRPGQRKTAVVDITDDLASANPDWIRLVVTKCPTLSDKVDNIVCT